MSSLLKGGTVKSLFFWIGNKRTNINEKKKNEKYNMFMMMNSRKQMKQTANKGERNQKVKLRENINSERDEESVKPQQ